MPSGVSAEVAAGEAWRQATPVPAFVDMETTHLFLLSQLFIAV